ncbi:MAG: site-specific integrase [Bacteroidetes bacterium]|uniref:site-specific integrase n=1 Tax=Flavobacterium sp. TaxID=239 RepID=UPI002FDB79F6|nr:site-specific integrase [Bacteroidota bacterium]
MNASLSILFYIKRAKVNKQGLCPIYVRVTVQSKRFEFSSNKFINPLKWSSEGAKVKGTSEEARTINNHLDNIKNEIFEAQKKLVLKDSIVNIENLKNQLFGTAETKRMLVSIFEDHNNKIKELVGKEYALGTLERYKTSLKHTIEFMKWKYNISDIEISKIDYAFVKDYEFFLRTVRNCANNTTVKYLKNFHKIIKLCLDNDWLQKNPFANYKSKVKEVERVFLNEIELSSIINKNFRIERLSLVRDIFVFSCYTGLAYIDVKNLSEMHIVIGIDGDKWIYTQRQKTESLSRIPLLPKALELLEKYKNYPQSSDKLFPVLSNQRMNSYLKEIADVCDIDKELTFHIARHTFATTVTLSNGVPIESISKMLGHKSIKITQHYAKIVDRKISDDMKMLRDKIIDEKKEIVSTV